MGLLDKIEAWEDAANAKGAAELSDADMPHAALPGESTQTADVTNAIFAQASVSFRDETGE